MIDFTGGVIERYTLSRPPANLFNIIMKGFERGSLISTGVSSDGDESNGIINGHAYSVTDARTINAGLKNQVKVVRIKNPWSNEVEWNGPFADKSPEWNFISEKEKREMKIQFCDDGEFYMTFSDFLEHFEEIELCHVSPDSFEAGDEIKKWNMSVYEGNWTSSNNYNPQIIVKLVDPDEFDDDDFCTLVVSLMQKTPNRSFYPMRFEVYKMNSDDVKKTILPNDFFLARKPVGTHKMEPYREICARFRVLPGHYVIIPQTLCNKPGEFMMRIFTESMRHGTDGKVIVKVNENFPENFEPMKNETKVEIFTIDDAINPVTATPWSSRPSVPRQESSCFLFWSMFIFLTGLVTLMFVLGFFVVVFVDQKFSK
jgi:calpain, invertebrate